MQILTARGRCFPCHIFPNRGVRMQSRRMWGTQAVQPGSVGVYCVDVTDGRGKGDHVLAPMTQDLQACEKGGQFPRGNGHRGTRSRQVF